MRTIAYGTIDKGDWGPGPWGDEPDKLQYPDEATGLPCLIRRSPTTGALCGYVGVAEGHPWHGVDYDRIDAEVHGGLTYAHASDPRGDEATSIRHEPEPGEPDHLWWLGFDASHAGDLCPAMGSVDARDVGLWSATVGGAGLGHPCSGGYRDLAYVKQEVADLARQVAAAGAAGDPCEEGRYGKGGPGTRDYVSFRD